MSVRTIVWSFVGVLFVGVLVARVPQRTADWLAQRAVALSENAGLERELVRERAFQQRLLREARAARDAAVADRKAANVASAHAVVVRRTAPAVCRPVIVADTMEIAALRKQLAAAQRLHEADVALDLSRQRTDSLNEQGRKHAIAVLETAPVVTSFWGRLFHPQVTVGVAPVAYTVDDQRLHVGAISVTVGYPL